MGSKEKIVYINASDFWMLERSGEVGALMVEPCRRLHYEDNRAILRGEKRLDEALSVKRSGGRKLYDRLNCTELDIHIVSEKLFQLFEKRKFRGWLRFPVEFRVPQQAAGYTYAGLAIVGRCGDLLEDRARPAFSLPYTREGRAVPVRVGYDFEASSYDGSDIFLSNSNTTPIVTTAVKEAISEEKLSNFSFTRMDLVEYY